MTMRLDIVTNDTGELVRREHARELGAGVVVSIYRLVKLAQMHDLGNQAFVRQLEQTHQMIGEYCLRSGSNVSVLFADKATFVAGQLLKGNRGAYESAAELGALLERIGGSELHISRDITREDCLAFAEQISLYHRTGNASMMRLPPKIRLRQVTDAARRGIDLEELTTDQRIIRAYASAVVIMRRFFEDLSSSRYVLPRRIKRIAQSIVDLSDAHTASFLGVTEARNANYDEAGRAVNTAILAVAIARESTTDRTVLSQIAMAAMMHDVARPRALALAGAGGSPMPGMAGPTTLSEDQEDRLAAGAAAVLTALGRVNEPTITRTVLTFEALWLRRKTWLGPVYWGARTPTLHATIIAVARRYNDLLTPEPGLQPPTTDFAIASLANELTDAQDRTVLRMLVSALGLLPTGTVVQLATGEVAEVVRGARGLGDKPRVKIVADANGAPFGQPTEVELSQDPRRSVHRVLGIDGWKQGLAQEQHAGHDDGQGPEPDEDVVVSVPPPPANAVAPPPNPGESFSASGTHDRNIADQYAQQYASWGGPEEASKTSDSNVSGEHPASASLPSMGSSPSAVAEAMGRMINDQLGPPAVPPREADRPDRTVFQPHGPDDAPARSVGGASVAREPTARGNLAATPLPHVLVYMLDHALTGSVVFEGTSPSPDLEDDTIYFVNGVPAKIRLADSVALLGEVLVEDGSIDEATAGQAVTGAQRLGILFGEYLVGHDLVSREALAWGLEGQLLRKIAHVANLAPEIEYAYYRDVDLLEGWGGDIVVSHPLNPILASVRHWTDRARVRATLNRIGKHPLVLHPDSDLANMAVIEEEQTVLDAIRSESIPLPQLFRSNLADEEVVSSLVYSLAVTRQFSFKGQKKGPMAARGVWQSVSPEPAASSPRAGDGRDGRGRPVSPTASGPITSPHAANVSSSRPAISVAKSAVGAPRSVDPPIPRSPAPNARPAPASVASQRAIAPAVRPTGTGSAPQIRPITGKKPTMVGLHAGSPPEARPVAPPSVRQLPSTSAQKAADVPHEPGAHPSSPPDDAKTIALPAPNLKELLRKRGGPPSPVASGTPRPNTPPANAPRPPPPKAGMPGLKTRESQPNLTATPQRPPLQGPAPVARPSSSMKAVNPQNVPPGSKGSSSGITGPHGFKRDAPPPSQRSHLATTERMETFSMSSVTTRSAAPVAPTALEVQAEAEPMDVPIELDDGSEIAGPNALGGRAIEIGDDGIADAEAALEAMSSFRSAEAALQRGDLAAAETYAQQAVSGDPTQSDYVVLLAWIKAARAPQAVPEAIRSMSKVLIEDPSSERALFFRAKLLIRTNRLHEAMNDLNELLAANPQHREAQSEARQLKSRLP